eukprot:365248-Chlamydomonas_euryale.AAC.4
MIAVQHEAGEADSCVSKRHGRACLHWMTRYVLKKLSCLDLSHGCTDSGVTLKTRKRNIVVPVDPASFANAVVAICQDSADAAGATTAQEELTAACKELENDSNLEFSRYGDTLFEVFFAGGMIAAGGKYVDEKSPKLKTHVRPGLYIRRLCARQHESNDPRIVLFLRLQILLAHPSHEAILPFVKVFASMTRWVLGDGEGPGTGGGGVCSLQIRHA